MAIVGGQTVHRYDTIDSTNDEARRLAEKGEVPPLWIVAARQTAGRGRRGRIWVSEPGNLYATVLYSPGQPQERLGQLGFVAALATIDALSAFCPSANLTLKWPNDVLATGRKVAGVLIEAITLGAGREPLLAVGIGVNVNGFPEEVAFPATCLSTVTGSSVNPDSIFSNLANEWERWCAVWGQDGFAPVRKAWLAHAAGIGDKIVARTGAAELEGVFQSIDHDGALLLQEPGGNVVRVMAGDVFFAPG